MQPRNDNRDWLARPDQGFGRSAFDYGHTYLEPEVEKWPVGWNVVMTVLCGLAPIAFGWAIYAEFFK